MGDHVIQDAARTADDARYPAIARPSGAFAMLALDQRETLRTMLAETHPGPVPDSELVRFKTDAARALTPAASAVLLDPAYALGPVETSGARAPGCGLIVATDRFEQAPGRPVERTWFDADLARRGIDAGADALKLLLIWRRDEGQEDRARSVEGFLAACRAAGVVGIVEGLVRGPRGSETLAGPALDDAILDCARELGAFGPDLYKGEVPTLGAGSVEQITALARAMTEAVGRRPWVVLSAGVPVERFEDAVAAACRGGASGFLAGRGIWRPALPAHERQAALRDVALPRLRRLAAIVDREARPWWAALPG